MTDNTGGPAFPITIDLGQDVEWYKGMTLRDYFAAKAMQALITRTTYFIEDELHRCVRRDVSEESYRYADAMLKAREAK